LSLSCEEEKNRDKIKNKERQTPDLEKGEVELRQKLVTSSELSHTLKSIDMCDVRSDEITLK